MINHDVPFVRHGPIFPLAITGGIAEGKSTVLGYLIEAGVRCISSDDIAREVWADHTVQESVQRLVGEDLSSDKKKFLDAIAKDLSMRRAVNLILHPRILSRMIGSGAQVVEVPLLIETCVHGLFQSVWVVTCGTDEQQRRLAKRVGDDQLARSLISAQLPSAIKIVFADQIIRTNQAPIDVHTQVVSLARTLGLA